MKLRKRVLWRLLGIGAALILAAGLIAPRLDADRFGARVRQSLEGALGHRVEIGKVRLDLFGGPGFSVEKVVIYDDAAAGAEPFAYVESLEARVGFASFWSGRLQFSDLRLVNPSVNLVRPEGGQWNFVPLVGRTAGVPAGTRFPELHVRRGRINFKFGNRKSIFYLTEASLDVSPPSRAGGRWQVRFQGAPARTDRPAQGFGTFRARGNWRPERATGGRIDLALELERSSLGELIRLSHGHDIGLHGQVSSRLRLSGPVSDIAVQGKLEISDIHRWDLLPPYSGYWPFELSGRVNLPGQELEITTRRDAPVALAVRAFGLLTRPRWAAKAALNGVPLDGAERLLQQMGITTIRELTIGGRMTGVVGYAPQTGLAGALAIEDLALRAPAAPMIRIPHGEVVIESGKATLAPATALLGASAAVRLEADYAWPSQALDLVATSASADIPETAAAARIFAPAPFLEGCTRGAWQGMLRCQSRPDAAAAWSGVFEVRNAAVPVDGLAAPVELTSARVAVRDSGATVDRMRGRVGPAAFEGEYRYRAAAARPHQARLRFEATDAAILEGLLAPTLDRSEGLITRALRLGRVRIPEWLAARHADAAITIAGLMLNGLDLGPVAAHVIWDGASVHLQRFSAHPGSGSVTGQLEADLHGPVPAYHFKGRFRGVSWAGGEWEGTTTLESAGLGLDLLRNLRIDGAFAGRSVELASDAQFKTIAGKYSLAMLRGIPRLHLADLEATMGDVNFAGKGASGADGRLDLEFSNGGRELKLTGTVLPFKLEALP